ncbi:hypothetical protein ACFWNC_30175 [Streptomyces sp. NPDC058369]|uniref:hypothetical protein n=1 Tax=unclassified Streptomyces TaxID=2593676 RepID=UPI00365B612B
MGEPVLGVVAVRGGPAAHSLAGPVDAVVTGEYAAFQQTAHEGHPEPAGEVVVVAAATVEGDGTAPFQALVPSC